MKNIYKITIILLLSIYALSCNKETEPGQVEYIGTDKISRIELSLNSPVLDADGKAELRFKAKCFYKYEDKEYQMLLDRVPMNKIEVFSSTGERFGINDVFTTKTVPTDGIINFHCKLGENISNKVSVKAIKPVDENYEPIVIPIQVYVIYDESTKNSIENINEETFQKLLDRTNQVFAGKLADAPSSCDSKISFNLTGIHKVKVKVEDTDLADYINDNLMGGTDDNFTIWIANTIRYPLSTRESIPKYTLGDPNDLKGLGETPNWWSSDRELIKVNSVEEAEENLKSSGAAQIVNTKGLCLSFIDFYSMLNASVNSPANRFEKVIARAYGLLDTGYYNPKESSNYENGDIDYCSDTFTYVDKFPRLEKVVFVPKEEEAEESESKEPEKDINYYDSFNIMDKNSTATTISRDQIKRIRKVIKDCPFRQMQLK